MQLEDQLVMWAEEIVRDARRGLKAHQDTGRTQASKAIDVAKMTDSLHVFRNWLRYQKAREEFWRVRDERGEDLALRLHEVIRRIEQISGGEETMKAVIRFLGYFRRALVAMDYLDQIPPATEGGEEQ